MSETFEWREQVIKIHSVEPAADAGRVVDDFSASDLGGGRDEARRGLPVERSDGADAVVGDSSAVSSTCDVSISTTITQPINMNDDSFI